MWKFDGISERKRITSGEVISSTKYYINKKERGWLLGITSIFGKLLSKAWFCENSFNKKSNFYEDEKVALLKAGKWYVTNGASKHSPPKFTDFKRNGRGNTVGLTVILTDENGKEIVRRTIP